MYICPKDAITYRSEFMKLSLTAACVRTLEGLSRPVITDYELWLVVCRLFVSRQVDGVKINIRNKIPDVQHLTRTIRALGNSGLLYPDADFGHKVFRFTNLPDKFSE